MSEIWMVGFTIGVTVGFLYGLLRIAENDQLFSDDEEK